MPPRRLLLTPPGFTDFLDDSTPQLCLASVERGYEYGVGRFRVRLGALQMVLRTRVLAVVGLFQKLTVQVDVPQSLPGRVYALLLLCCPRAGIFCYSVSLRRPNVSRLSLKSQAAIALRDQRAVTTRLCERNK